MFRRILALVRKELTQVFRDPLTMRLTLLAPLLQLLLFGYVVRIDVNDIPTVLLDHDRSAASRQFVQQFESSGYFTFTRTLTNEQEIDALMDEGNIDMALIIPRDFGANLSSGRNAEVLAVINGSDSNTATTVGNYFAAITARFSASITQKVLTRGGGETALPVDFRSRLLFNPEASSSVYTIPGIIAVLLVMLLIMLSAISVVREKERGTLEQISVTPVTTLELLLGKTLPFLLLGTVITIVLTPVAILWFGIPFRGSFLLMVSTALLYMVSCIGFGLLVGAASETQQQALMLSMFAIVPQILLSGFIFPISAMPEVIQWISYILPSRYFLIVVRAVFLKGVGAAFFTPELISLAVLSAALFSLAAFRFRRSMGV